MSYTALAYRLPGPLRRHVLYFEGAIEEAVEALARELPAGARILDAGAGEAQYARCFARQRYCGVDLAVGAIALLRKKEPILRLLIIGDGPDRNKLYTMVQEQGLDDRITLTDMIPLEQVAETMAHIDLGVVPKRKNSFSDEAFSTKIMEFMAMGVPVLASDTRIDQWYFDGGEVQFFESENVHDLATKIMDLASNPAKRDALKAHGMQFIAKNNWDIKKHEYFELVDRLIQRQSTISPRQHSADSSG